MQTYYTFLLIAILVGVSVTTKVGHFFAAPVFVFAGESFEWSTKMGPGTLLLPVFVSSFYR